MKRKKIIISLIILLIICGIIVYTLILQKNNSNNKIELVEQEQYEIELSIMNVLEKKYLPMKLNNSNSAYMLVNDEKTHQYGLGLYNSMEECNENLNETKKTLNIDGKEYKLYKTNIKYKDYKSEMLKYVSEEIFNNEFEAYVKNIFGTLYVIKNDNNISSYYLIRTINVEKNEDNLYEFWAHITLYNMKTNDEETTYIEGKVQRDKLGNYVILECNEAEVPEGRELIESIIYDQ